MREKWDSRRGESSYGAQTIATVLAGRTDFYSFHSEARRPISTAAAVAQVNGRAATAEPDPPEVERTLVGRAHSTVLAEEIPESSELIEGVIDAGSVGEIVGLPFARKSYFLHELATKVAVGDGLVLGRFKVARPGPVVVVWEDDSTANELRRIQEYAAAHAYSDELPIRWLLNEGVRLPDDIPALAEIVSADGAVVLGIDSLYNVLAPGISLREEEVAQVLVELKRGIADSTGCTVAVVDHSPWPTESNRGQRRAFGSVFKTAAVRWSIHLEADLSDPNRLWVEAAGNNVTGFRRSLAAFDPATLEIRLLDVQRIDEDALDKEVFEHVSEHPGEATSTIAKTLHKRRENVEKALERLEAPGRVNQLCSKSSAELGRPGTGRYWFALNDAPSDPSQLFGTGQDDSALALVQDGDPSRPSTARRADGSPDESLESARTGDSSEPISDPISDGSQPGIASTSSVSSDSPRGGS
jgi:hypothetical protein